MPTARRSLEKLRILKFNNERSILELFEILTGIKHWREWYYVSSSQLSSSVNNLLRDYQYSLPLLLGTHFPQYEWRVDQFEHWNFIEPLDSSSEHPSTHSYQSSSKSSTNSPKSRSKSMKSSSKSTSASTSTSSDKEPWEEGTPYQFWNEMSNHRRYFDWLGKKLGFNKMSDWYGLTTSQLKSNFGSTLLTHYRGQIKTAIICSFPEFHFEMAKFDRLPSIFFTDESYLKRYVEDIGRHLNIKNIQDWYYVKHSDLSRLDSKNVISSNGGLPDLIRRLYPDANLLPWGFQHIHYQGFWMDQHEG